MTKLVTHHLLFTTQVVTPLELDDYSGSALRGNLFEAVWKRFCTNKEARTCAECPLHTMCPVSALVAPLREENTRGRDVPRPYIILPPLGRARLYEPGEQLIFGLTLFGNIVQLLPYIMLSIGLLEAAGLGRRVKQHDWQRGRFCVNRVDAYNPLNGERQTLYTKGEALVNVPSLSVSKDDVAHKATALSCDKISLDFLTPIRLVDREHLVRQAHFRPLIHRLVERLTALQREYSTDTIYSMDEQRSLIELADGIECTRDETHWEDIGSYSGRQKRVTPIGGLMGRATFTGDLTPFRELLTWGELIHVGKSCVKGNGWYKIATS